MTDEQLLRTGPLARRLGVSPKSVTRLIVESGLPVAKLTPHGHRRYLWSQVEPWLEEQQALARTRKAAYLAARQAARFAARNPQPEPMTPSTTPVPAGGLNGEGRAR